MVPHDQIAHVKVEMASGMVLLYIVALCVCVCVCERESEGDHIVFVSRNKDFRSSTRGLSDVDVKIQCNITCNSTVNVIQ